MMFEIPYLKTAKSLMYENKVNNPAVTKCFLYLQDQF